jgi:ubiquinone/menaquinone biosynthesis C-methylase UbiE
MNSIEESVLESMDATDKELFQYLPYILQDLWEIGSSFKAMNALILKNKIDLKNKNVLDLGCGKGAISVKLAKSFSCQSTGVDAVEEFINEAKIKANDYNIANLCNFQSEDIRTFIKEVTKQYDLIILGAIGTIFGDYFNTLSLLKPLLNENGSIIIDDSYYEVENNELITKVDILMQIERANMILVDEHIINKKNVFESDAYMFERIEKRCYELIIKFPKKRQIYENYIKSQLEENEILESKVINSNLLISNKK